MLRRRELMGVAGSALVAAAPARAAFVSTPDVVVYGETTLVPALRAVGAAFRDRTGAPVRVFRNLGPQGLALVARSARCDVVVTGVAWIAQGEARGLIQAGTRVGTWSEPTVLAGRDRALGSAPPGGAALPALLAGKPLGVIDPTYAGGPDGVALVGRLGWAVPLAGAIDGPGVAFLVRQGTAGLGLMPRSAALADPALTLVASVPTALQAPCVYAAGAARDPLSRYTAPFLAYLKTAEAGAVLQRGGLEAAP